MMRRPSGTPASDTCPTSHDVPLLRRSIFQPTDVQKIQEMHNPGAMGLYILRVGGTPRFAADAS